ncbi:MAG: DUF561 domain-containing protein [Bacteroidota bacterium]|jgi:cyclase
MYRKIPVLLLNNRGFVKGKNFSKHRYIGDPINIVRIFNEKQVDEICILDISRSNKSDCIKYDVLAEICSEAFMPLSYGGGIRSIQQAEQVLRSGAEKIIFNTAAFSNPELIRAAVSIFGSSTILVNIDVRFFTNDYYCYSFGGQHFTHIKAISHAKYMERLGVGEIMVTSIDKEGTKSGCDLALIDLISSAVSVPIIASGGVGSKHDFKLAFDAGASAIGAGSYFCFYGDLDGVLITYDV